MKKITVKLRRAEDLVNVWKVALPLHQHWLMQVLRVPMYRIFAFLKARIILAWCLIWMVLLIISFSHCIAPRELYWT